MRRLSTLQRVLRPIVATLDALITKKENNKTMHLSSTIIPMFALAMDQGGLLLLAGISAIAITAMVIFRRPLTQCPDCKGHYPSDWEGTPHHHAYAGKRCLLAGCEECGLETCMCAELLAGATVAQPSADDMIAFTLQQPDRAPITYTADLMDRAVQGQTSLSFTRMTQDGQAMCSCGHGPLFACGNPDWTYCG